MPVYFRLVTRWSPAEVMQRELDLKEDRIHPRDAKMLLAKDVTSSLYGEEAASKAQGDFIRRFQKHDLPNEMPEVRITSGQTVLDVLTACNFISTRSEGRRLLDQKGVKLDGEVLADGMLVFPHSGVLQVGKRHFARIVLD